MGPILTDVKLLVASDLHGGSAAFRGFVRLAKHLEPQICVICGDWSGKQVVFFSEERTGRRYLEGERWTQVVPHERIVAHERELKDVGYYLLEFVADEDEASFAERERTARVTRLTQWLEFGHSELAQIESPLVAVCGNDDDDLIEDLLDEHPWTENVGERSKTISGIEFFGLGYSNETPWDTTRERSESEIAEMLHATIQGVQRVENAVGVIHVPPIASELDYAPGLEKTSTGLRRTGVDRVPVGSTAVRAFIEEKQPLMTLSGHCHTSAGVTRLGRTYCFNPGSLYHTGSLCAFEVHIGDGEVRSYQRFVR